MNENLAIQKGLIINGNNERYVYIQNIYKYFFEKYLLEKINILHYNNLIKDSNLDFGVPHPTKEELATNLNEYFNFEYIYLINSFFVEKLSIEQINMLVECSIRKDFAFSLEIREMIESTYKEVIRKNFFKGEYVDKRYKVCYGAVTSSNFANNDELVLKILYSRNTKQLSDSEYIVNIKEKKKYLNDLTKLLKEEILSKLGVECTVLIEKISR